MDFSLKLADYNSLAEFIAALDASISRKALDLARSMSMGIEHEDLFQELLDEYLLRITYEYDYDVSSLTLTGTFTRVTIPLTADMTFIYSDATGI